jgi:hypothetical protein
LKHLEYLMAANEDPTIIAEHQSKIFRKVVKYAVLEKDRLALHEKLRNG